MRTVGRHVPGNRFKRGVYVALCDCCAARYYGDQLVQKEDGTKLCTGPSTLNCARGRVGVTLDRLNGEHAKNALGGLPATTTTGTLDDQGAI